MTGLTSSKILPIAGHTSKQSSDTTVPNMRVARIATDFAAVFQGETVRKADAIPSDEIEATRTDDDSAAVESLEDINGNTGRTATDPQHLPAGTPLRPKAGQRASTQGNKFDTTDRVSLLRDSPPDAHMNGPRETNITEARQIAAIETRSGQSTQAARHRQIPADPWFALINSIPSEATPSDQGHSSIPSPTERVDLVGLRRGHSIETGQGAPKTAQAELPAPMAPAPVPGVERAQTNGAPATDETGQIRRATGPAPLVPGQTGREIPDRVLAPPLRSDRIGTVATVSGSQPRQAALSQLATPATPTRSPPAEHRSGVATKSDFVPRPETEGPDAAPVPQMKGDTVRPERKATSELPRPYLSPKAEKGLPPRSTPSVEKVSTSPPVATAPRPEGVQGDDQAGPVLSARPTRTAIVEPTGSGNVKASDDTMQSQARVEKSVPKSVLEPAQARQNGSQPMPVTAASAAIGDVKPLPRGHGASSMDGKRTQAAADLTANVTKAGSSTAQSVLQIVEPATITSGRGSPKPALDQPSLVSDAPTAQMVERRIDRPAISDSRFREAPPVSRPAHMSSEPKQIALAAAPSPAAPASAAPASAAPVPAAPASVAPVPTAPASVAPASVAPATGSRLQLGISPAKEAQPDLPFDLALSTSTSSGVSSATVAAAAPADPGRHIGVQLASAMINKIDAGSVEIALDPEELGRVQMNLKTRGDILTLTIAAERPETLDLMRRHIDQLASEFREMGYEKIAFSFGGSHMGKRGDEGHQSEGGAHASELIETGQIDETPDTPRINSSGLDMRL